MRESEIMFRVGWISIAVVAMLLSTLQVCYDTQNDERNRVRAAIVDSQQEIAVAQANFASYVRPEILRNLVVSISPDAEVVSFHKSVDINDLPNRETSDEGIQQ